MTFVWGRHSIIKLQLLQQCCVTNSPKPSGVQQCILAIVLCNKQPQTQWRVAVHISHHTHAYGSVGQLEMLFSHMFEFSGTRAFFLP